MTQIEIKKTNPVFIAGVKSQQITSKKRFGRYFAIIKGTKAEVIHKLKHR